MGSTFATSNEVLCRDTFHCGSGTRRTTSDSCTSTRSCWSSLFSVSISSASSFSALVSVSSRSTESPFRRSVLIFKRRMMPSSATSQTECISVFRRSSSPDARLMMSFNRSFSFASRFSYRKSATTKLQSLLKDNCEVTTWPM